MKFTDLQPSRGKGGSFCFNHSFYFQFTTVASHAEAEFHLQIRHKCKKHRQLDKTELSAIMETGYIIKHFWTHNVLQRKNEYGLGQVFFRCISHVR